MKSPFKFIASYTREDREIFFGREQEINELYRRVFESKNTTCLWDFRYRKIFPDSLRIGKQNPGKRLVTD
jgi:hypothetical protein